MSSTSYLIINAIVLLGAFTQSLSGFGVALVCMALLPGVIGIQNATPLVALISLTLEAVLLLRYRGSLSVRAIQPLVIASLIGIPIGVWALSQVNEKIVLSLLGMIIAGYAAYALLGFRLPEIKRPIWIYGVGFLAGLLGGAYNTSGPPVVIYADSRRWEPAEFKGNLQGFFIVNSVFVVASHAWSHNFTTDILIQYLWALPALAVGILAGIGLSGRIQPLVFRRVVLVLLIVMGLRLAFSWLWL